MVNTKKKRYRVTDGFTYKGEAGNDKQEKWYVVGPGEKLPKLDNNEIEKLLYQQKICELDDEGLNIPNKRVHEMNEEEIERLFAGKNPNALSDIIRGTNFGVDTLNKMLIYAEKNRLNTVASMIDQKLMN